MFVCVFLVNIKPFPGTQKTKKYYKKKLFTIKSVIYMKANIYWMVKRMNDQVLTLVLILFIFSIFLNIFQYVQIKRYKLNERSFKVSWQEAMNLKNPISLFAWWMLGSSLAIALIFGFVSLFIN
ncbi:hypothetical protein ABV89_18765 [Priestia aryabhattai]|nr:hypothetical protein VL11_25760 [Priestia aryabhattai]KMN98234.1 hypothetical protein ABV89_18765 [Priestia aryabhattai]